LPERGLSAAWRWLLTWWIDHLHKCSFSVALAALVLSAAALGYALPHLGINTSTEDMISADAAFRRHHAAFVQAFPQFSHPIVAVIEGATPERVEEAAGALAKALRADGEHFVAADVEAGDPFLIAHGLLYLKVNELADLTDRLAAAQPLLAVLAEAPNLSGLASLAELALRQPGAGGSLPPELDRLLAAMAGPLEAQLAGRAGELSWRQALEGGDPAVPSRQLVIAEPRYDPNSLAVATPAIEAVRAHAHALGIDTGSGLRLSMTGEATLNQEELQSVRAGATVAAVLSTAVVTVLLIWGVRSLRLIVHTMISLGVGLVLTAGFAALVIGQLNLISVTFAVLFVGLGVDFGIHFVMRYREAFDVEGGHGRAVAAAIRWVGGPTSLSALCAAFGFLAFVPTDYRGLAELGIISAAGMVIALLTTIVLLPALLDLVPLSGRERPLGRPRLLPEIQRHPRPVVMVAGLAALLSLILLPKVTFDFNPLNLKDPQSESVRTYRALAADPATSPDVAEILTGSLPQADALAAQLVRLNEVKDALTLSSFVPTDQDAKLGLISSLALYLDPSLQQGHAAVPLDDAGRQAALARLTASAEAAKAPGPNPGAARLAEALGRFTQTRPSAAAVAELERRLTGTLPALLDRLRQALAAGPVTLADLPDNLRAHWLNPDGRARVLVRPPGPLTDNARLEAFARAVLSVAPEATGTPIMVLQAGDAVVGAFRQASLLVFGVIMLLLAWVLRRPRDILLVLAPLGLAVLLTAATAVLLGLSLNFANVIVLPLLLGLGVSGAIHVVMRWRVEAFSDRIAVTSTPRAVLFSALTTVASFGSLAVSPHRGLASMGLLLTIAILWSIVSTLVVLPNVLALLGRRVLEEQPA
jgi:hopanoid biosynthesis associated RND transporter like protein HpnN